MTPQSANDMIVIIMSCHCAHTRQNDECIQSKHIIFAIHYVYLAKTKIYALLLRLPNCRTIKWQKQTDHPSVSAALTSHPYSTRNWTASKWPAQTALCSAVMPSSFASLAFFIYKPPHQYHLRHIHSIAITSTSDWDHIKVTV